MANPIKAYGYLGKGRASMRLLKREILEGILLRRTKVQCADVLMLPPRYEPKCLKFGRRSARYHSSNTQLPWSTPSRSSSGRGTRIPRKQAGYNSYKLTVSVNDFFDKIFFCGRYLS